MILRAFGDLRERGKEKNFWYKLDTMAMVKKEYNNPYEKNTTE